MCKPTRVGVPFVVCVAVVVTAVHCLCMELYDSYTWRLTNVMVHVCLSLRWESFPRIWLGTKVKVAEQFCSTIKAFILILSITVAPSDHGFWLFSFVGITPNLVKFKVGVLIVM